MKVCYFGTYRDEYSRNRIMIESLRCNGVEVEICHEPFWTSIEERVELASGGWTRLAFLHRVLRVYWRLWQRRSCLKSCDIVVLGYPGQFDVFLARFITWLYRKYLVMDVFMSLYLIATERGLVDKSPLTGRLIYWIEKIGLSLPNLLIQDTSDYVNWFEKVYGLKPERFRLVPTGADNRIFQPRYDVEKNTDYFVVLYYGTFIPNHGIPYIIEAAKFLRDERDVLFEMIGDGPDKPVAQKLVQDYGLRNVVFRNWMSQQELLNHLARADIVLGAFGHTPQSMMTIQNKIYEALAAGKSVITGDSPAIRQTFQHGVHLYLCDRNDPSSLAKAIVELKSSPETLKYLGQNGSEIFYARYSLQRLGELYRAHLEALLK